MQSVSSRIWTSVAVSISYSDSHYTTGNNGGYAIKPNQTKTKQTKTNQTKTKQTLVFSNFFTCFIEYIALHNINTADEVRLRELSIGKK